MHIRTDPQSFEEVPHLLGLLCNIILEGIMSQTWVPVRGGIASCYQGCVPFQWLGSKDDNKLYVYLLMLI